MKDKIFIVLVIFVVLATIGLTRKNLNYGIETDFLWQFQPEALRLIKGAPLELNFHPPFYPIVLALFFKVFGNWQIVGILISLISALVILFTSYQFLRTIFSDQEALGGLMGLLLSPTFIIFSLQASSDIFFHALFYTSLCLVSSALKKNNYILWALSGAFAVLTLLTRANGIVVIFFFLFPLILYAPIKHKAKYFISMLCGFSIPFMAWLWLARASGSPPYVKYNYANLAMNYFTDNPGSVDSTLEAIKKFSNIKDVLIYDPKKMIFNYATDLIRKILILFTNDSILAFPLILFVLPGVVLLFYRKLDRFRFLLLIILVSNFMLLNFAGWMDRLYIVFIPIMGAGAFAFAKEISLLFGIEKSRKFIATIFVISSLFYSARLIHTYNRVFIEYSSSDSIAAAELIEKKENDGERYVIARKPHLSFYSHSKQILFPNAKTFDELKSSILTIFSNISKDTSIYLFYGKSERAYRSKFSILAEKDYCIHWLERIGGGNENGGWVLYRVLPHCL